MYGEGGRIKDKGELQNIPEEGSCSFYNNITNIV
jgi:hypothetical protein